MATRPAEMLASSALSVARTALPNTPAAAGPYWAYWQRYNHRGSAPRKNDERSLRVKSGFSICGLLLATLLMYAPAARAQTYGSSPSGGHSEWRAMRQQMIAACANKSAGAACSFTREGQTMTGVCRATRRDQLVCRSGKRGRRRRTDGLMGGAMPSRVMPRLSNALQNCCGVLALHGSSLTAHAC